MYSLLGNELNLWIGLFLLCGGQARSILILAILDQVIGRTCQIMGLICHLRTFCPWDVLSLGKFCPFGRFVPLDVLSLGRFVLGRFVLYVHQIYNAWQSWVSGIFLSFATTITQQHNRASVACKSTKICKASVSKWSSLNKYSYNAVSHNYLVVVAAVVACAQL